MGPGTLEKAMAYFKWCKNSKIEDSGGVDWTYRDSHPPLDILCNIRKSTIRLLFVENPKGRALTKAWRNFLVKENSMVNLSDDCLLQGRVDNNKFYYGTAY